MAKLACDYCRCGVQKKLYMITLTCIVDTKDTCTKIICEKCASRLGMTLDTILDERDIDDALKDIEKGLLDDESDG